MGLHYSVLLMQRGYVVIRAVKQQRRRSGGQTQNAAVDVVKKQERRSPRVFSSATCRDAR